MAFPFELYRLIIQNIDTRSDLYALLFVSGIISYEAERVLYHAIHILTIKPRTIKLFLHLSRCARVARHVRELSIHDTVPSFGRLTPETGFQNFSQYWQLFNKTLSALTNLRVLKLTVPLRGFSGYPPIPSAILSGCTFKLQVLSLTDCIGEEFPDIDLTQVKELSLEYYNYTHYFQFHPDAFPSLQVVALSPSQFHAFGCTNIHHVKALNLISRPRFAFKETFPNVTSLAASESMLQPFPSVRYFRTLQLLSQVTDDAKLTALLRKYASLKKLEKLCFAIFESIDRFPPDLNIHTKVFSEIDSLQEFVLVNRVRGSGRLWKRNGEEAIDVSGLAAYDEWKDSRWF